MNIRFADTPTLTIATRSKLVHRAPARAAPIVDLGPITPRRLAGHLLHGGKAPLPVVARGVPAVNKMLDDPRATAEQIMDDVRFLQSDVDDTLTHYLAAIALDEKQTQAAKLLGHVLLDHHEVDAAKTCFDHVRQRAPSEPLLSHAYFNLGEAYRESDKSKMATGAYRQSIKLDPTNTEAMEGLGLAYMDLKNDILAIMAFSDYLAIIKDNAHIWCNLGICWRNMNAWEAAAKSYRQALLLDNKLTAARFNLCLIYLRLQMFGPLIGEYLILKRQDPALARQLEPLIVTQ